MSINTVGLVIIWLD